MKAYIINENELDLLKKKLELVEEKCRTEFKEHSASNQPVGATISRVHYAIYTWISEVTR